MTGRIAMVTGAGSGIGRSVAIALASRGYRVALIGRRQPPLDAVAGEIGTAGGQAIVLCADVAHAAEVDAAFDATVAQWSRIDLLFNNAGLSAPAVPIDELPVDAWQSVIDVNLTGAFLCLRSAFRVMKAQSPRGGRIINNGSISAHVPRPNSFAYTASKHGVTGLTRSAALDGRAFDIACGQIDIGNAATPMTAPMMSGVLQADGRIASEPTMDVCHVAEAVLYMDSLPLNANVQFMTVMATAMPFIGRG